MSSVRIISVGKLILKLLRSKYSGGSYYRVISCRINNQGSLSGASIIKTENQRFSH